MKMTPAAKQSVTMQGLVSHDLTEQEYLDASKQLRCPNRPGEATNIMESSLTELLPQFQQFLTSTSIGNR